MAGGGGVDAGISQPETVADLSWTDVETKSGDVGRDLDGDSAITLDLDELDALDLLDRETTNLDLDGANLLDLDILDTLDLLDREVPGLDTAADTLPDVVVELVPCDNNLDCVGGQICRDAFCRNACDEWNPCAAPYPVCDPDAGYCVECVGDYDCLIHHVCVGRTCQFHCKSDDGCTDMQYCKVETGECVARECNKNSECLGGYKCSHYVCVPIEEIICAANSVRCVDAKTLGTCNSAGTKETTSSCGDLAACVSMDGGGALCLEIICEASAVGCLDDVTSFSCDQTGTALTTTPCQNDRYCEAGACLDRICVPNQALCDGNSTVTCNAIGSEVKVAPCSELAACKESGFGCICKDGACKVRVCTPGAGQCADSGLQTCASDGLSWGAGVSCGTGKKCLNGTCLPDACQAGTKSCSGEKLMTCNANGTGYNEENCAADGKICEVVSGTAQCKAKVCVPDSVRCDAAQAWVITCDPRGAKETSKLCIDQTYCKEGACVPMVCVPNSAAVCLDGDAKKCNTIGSAYTLVADCNDTTQRCKDGQCRNMICTPNATRCNGDVRYLCAADGLTESPTDCVTLNSYCNNGECAPWVCAPGSAAICSAAGDSVKCNSRGTGYEVLKDCATGTQTCKDGECKDMICIPGATRCSGEVRYLCLTDGLSEGQIDCTKLKAYCNNGECAPWICTPGSATTCSPGGDAVRCNSRGTGYDLITDCTAGTQICKDGQCVNIICTPGAKRCNGDILMTCVADGTSETPTDCAASLQYCNAATLACVNRVCVPGSANLCLDGDVKKCNANGSGYDLVQDCSALGCLAAACIVGCGDGVCGSGETKCNCKTDCGDPCAGKTCGDDGCGGTCGTCASDCTNPMQLTFDASGKATSKGDTTFSKNNRSDCHLSAGPDNVYYFDVPTDTRELKIAISCSFNSTLGLVTPPFSCTAVGMCIPFKSFTTLYPGAGRYYLGVDGQLPTDLGAYTLTVTLAK